MFSTWRVLSAARTVTHRTSSLARAREIAGYHELLVNLVRLELKAKYKASALGFAWSLLNPAMYLVVFYIAFDVILGGGIPRFPIYLLSALLVWNFFTAALNSGTGSDGGRLGSRQEGVVPPGDPAAGLGRGRRWSTSSSS